MYIVHIETWILYTVRPAHAVTSIAVTCIKKSFFSCPLIENFIWIKPLLRSHLSYKATFFFLQRWPLNTGLTRLFNVNYELTRTKCLCTVLSSLCVTVICHLLSINFSYFNHFYTPVSRRAVLCDWVWRASTQVSAQ